jgi:hypothetical protein
LHHRARRTFQQSDSYPLNDVYSRVTVFCDVRIVLAMLLHVVDDSTAQSVPFYCTDDTFSPELDTFLNATYVPKIHSSNMQNVTALFSRLFARPDRRMLQAAV